jgi:hypothetical protein
MFPQLLYYLLKWSYCVTILPSENLRIATILPSENPRIVKYLMREKSIPHEP